MKKILLISAFCILTGVSSAFAVSVFSTKAETFFANRCTTSAVGNIAALCDLRERVIALELSSDVNHPVETILYYENGYRVGPVSPGASWGASAKVFWEDYAVWANWTHSSTTGAGQYFENTGEQGSTFDNVDLKFSTEDCSGTPTVLAFNLPTVVLTNEINNATGEFDGSLATLPSYYKVQEVDWASEPTLIKSTATGLGCTVIPPENYSYNYEYVSPLELIEQDVESQVYELRFE